jgi:cytoskeletal protein CcmA (bactofilin family)
MTRPQRTLEPAKRVPLAGGSNGGQLPGQRDRPPKGTLIVGHGIEVKGGIGACETLIVEGTVEASLDVKSLEVAEGGLCRGKLEVGDAEIAGLVEGDITVRGKLKILSSGRVSGTLRYATISIEPGGQVAGDVDVMGDLLAESGAA